jgi:hypothetical protein
MRAQDWREGVWRRKHPDPRAVPPRLFTVGRLDVASTGLIFVTNDGVCAPCGMPSPQGCACSQCRHQACVHATPVHAPWAGWEMVTLCSRLRHPACMHGASSAALAG